MTWPLYGVIMFFIFIVSMILFALLFPKCNLLGSFVDDRFEVSTLDSASMDCVWVCMFVCVCFIRASINSIFLVCLLFSFICYTPKQTEPQSWITNIWNLENQNLNLMIWDENNDDTEALSSFYFDWIYECGQSFMQLKQKEKEVTSCAPDKCIFYCGTKRYCGQLDPLTYIGILDFNGHLQRERDKDKVLL